MNHTFKLKRVIQCAKCPWKVSTNAFEIPDGYSVELHKNLSKTIAVPGDLRDLKIGVTRAMACHHSSKGEREFCVGYLNNQLGAGNNIALRLSMINCENIGDIKVVGPQHSTFEETIPGEFR